MQVRLANEKYKSKSATRTSSNTTVTWLEQFDFHLFEDQAHFGSHLLEINLFETKTLGREDAIARYFHIAQDTFLEGSRFLFSFI